MLRLLRPVLLQITQARATLASGALSKVKQLSRATASLPYRKKFFLQVLGCSAALHCFFLLGLFFLYHSQVQVARISLRSQSLQNANVVFVPWVKRMSSGQRAGGELISRHQLSLKKKLGLTIADAPVKKKAIKQKKKIQSQKKKQKNIKKELPKKKNEKKRLVPKKEEIKKVEQKVPEKVVAKKETSEVLAQAAVAIEPVYIGREEKEMLELEQAIADDIKEVWKVPLGFVWEQPCRVRLSVDLAGKAHDILFEKTSGIMVVDLSITNALEQATFNKLVRGKELTLFFES